MKINLHGRVALFCALQPGIPQEIGRKDTLWGKQLLRTMKLVAIILTACCLQVSAYTKAQVTISVKEVTLDKIFIEIEKQVGLPVMYSQQEIKGAKKVSLQVTNMPVEEVLKKALAGQPFGFRLEANSIFVYRKNEKPPLSQNKSINFPIDPIEVTIKVSNQDGEPVAGVTIQEKGGKINGFTDGEGICTIRTTPEAILVLTAVNIITKEVKVEGKTIVEVKVNGKTGELDETVIKGYYSTTKRFNTGSVGKVTSKEIEKQPVSNPLATLQGKVSGLVVTQASGLPTSTFTVQIRGKGSLYNGTQPLYVVDGVPFLNDNNSSIITGGQSPLIAINKNDIESVEVLKDADATAIYGSQGANGVILITTKKGKAGETKVNISYNTGLGKVTRTPPLMNTAEYLKMREKAFTNDNVIADVTNAPDLVVWDKNAYTDWKKMLIGGTAKSSNIQASVSGGNSTTQFLVSGSFESQTTVFPESNATTKATGLFNIKHTTPNKKFKVQLGGTYSVFKPQLPNLDMGSLIFLPPNAPAIYDAQGKLNWTDWLGVDNPMASTLKKITSETSTLLVRSMLEYSFTPSFSLKANLGYTSTLVSDENLVPIRSLRPDPTNTGTASWANNDRKNWIVEPQFVYTNRVSKATVQLLAGASFQERREKSMLLSATEFTDDDLLGNLASAGKIVARNAASQYRYTAAFGNFNVNWDNKYLLNANIRRDGSSRFGPAKRFSTFGAVGLGWVFTNEDFLSKSSVLSFGKIRSSMGVTGNDQIRDYAYLDTWSSPIYAPYQGATAILPTRLFNENFQWERNKKFELGLELGFLQDRIMLSSGYYKNICGNQLIDYTIPSQTGFTTLIVNSDATIKNSGYEFELSSQNISGGNLKWSTNINITIPKSKLLKYPNLEETPYRLTYQVGQPVDIRFGYNYLGINDMGVYSFEDINGDGTLGIEQDYKNIGSLAPKFYGGIQNTVSFKGWELMCFFYFVKQNGYNYLATLLTTPGMMGNQPTSTSQEWQKNEDVGGVQKYTVNQYSDAGEAYRNLTNSSGAISDASFIRLRNVSLSYNLSQNWVSRFKLKGVALNLQAQNLWTITNYKGSDPETQSVAGLPPLKNIVFGLQINL